MSEVLSQEQVRLSVENVGGIDEAEVEFEPGVNVLAGRNATNRTSLLRAIMAALGSDDVSLKSDETEGRVELQIGSETYTRTFERTNGTVVTGGDPYLDDPTLADLFAFLLATNETRQTVLTEGNLRELIMRPVDTEAIKAEIADLEDEKDRIDAELEELSQLKGELPDLERERASISDRIEEKEAALEEKRAEIDEADASVDETREEKNELESRMAELGDVRSDLEATRKELRAQRSSLESLEDQHEELSADVEELPDAPAGEISEIDDEIDRLRDRKQAVQSEVNTLQRIIQFNEDTLEGASTDVLEALTGDDDGGSVTDRILEESEQVVCWTCGHEVDRADIEETVDRLRDLQQDKLARTREIADDIDDLETERIEYEEKQRQREQVTRQLERTEEQIASREETIDELEDRRDALEDEIREIEDTVDDLQTRKDSTVLELHKEANQLEVDINRLEADREEVDEEIDRIDSELARRDRIEERREEVRTELEDLRTRIDQIESEATESFNHHMETVLDALAYDNLARIWIERGETEVREGRRKVTEREFTLHIVRESESGTAYEDTIRNLSESEREVTGLVFALAGYLVHDVHEEVPFMLLDSLEAIDSGRIARLIEYFEDYPDVLVAALLPEDAAATSDDYATISNI